MAFTFSFDFDNPFGLDITGALEGTAEFLPFDGTESSDFAATASLGGDVNGVPLGDLTASLAGTAVSDGQNGLTGDFAGAFTATGPLAPLLGDVVALLADIDLDLDLGPVLDDETLDLLFAGDVDGGVSLQGDPASNQLAVDAALILAAASDGAPATANAALDALVTGETTVDPDGNALTGVFEGAFATTATGLADFVDILWG